MPADCYVFAGGGTGGHLYPALAIAAEIRSMVPGARICFIGTKGKIESRVVPAEGYEFRTLWIGGFRRSLSPWNLLVPVKAVVAMIQAWRHLRELRPRVVIGTGGYVSGPVLFAASMMDMPTLIHEQNSVPGETTKFLSKRASEVHVSFEETMGLLPPAAKVFLSGNPTRSVLQGIKRDQALKFFGMDPNNGGRVLLVSGGSLGARSVNSAVLENIDSILGMGFRIVWQTGQTDAARIAAATDQCSRLDVWTGAFIDRMDYAYAAADLALCRAGATTIAELTRLGKAAILVPYPLAAADHQTLNARAMETAGAAVVIGDAMVGKQLVPALRGILEPGRLGEMAKASFSLGKPGAAEVIAKHVLALNRSRTS